MWGKLLGAAGVVLAATATTTLVYQHCDRVSVRRNADLRDRVRAAEKVAAAAHRATLLARVEDLRDLRASETCPRNHTKLTEELRAALEELYALRKEPG